MSLCCFQILQDLELTTPSAPLRHHLKTSPTPQISSTPSPALPQSPLPPLLSPAPTPSHLVRSQRNRPGAGNPRGPPLLIAPPGALPQSASLNPLRPYPRVRTPQTAQWDIALLRYGGCSQRNDRGYLMIPVQTWLT